MNKICKSCGCEYTPVGKRPGTILWDRRKYCTRSCAQTKHGKAGTFEYKIWMGIISRCHTKSSSSYRHYGAKGIRVCDRWKNSFPDFLTDMGQAPSKKHSIERKDVRGNYEPSNCCWLKRTLQGRNTRRSRRIIFCGEERSLSEWCELLNIPYYRTHSRIHKLGWSIEKALTVPKLEGPATIHYAGKGESV